MKLTQSMDLQGLLLPGAVAAVVGLCVLYLIWRLFVSSSSTKPGHKGSKKNQNKSKRPSAAKKKPATTPKVAQKPVPSSTDSESESTPSSSPAVTRPVPAPKKKQEQKPKPKNEGKKKKRASRGIPEEENIADFLPIDITKDRNETKEVKTKVTGKEKIAAAQGEPLAEGWEIVGAKQNKRKEEKKKEREEERKKEQDAPATETQGNEDKKGRKRERREGGRDNDKKPRGDKGPRGDRGPRGPRTDDRRKDEKPEEKEKAFVVVSEKTKRREEIKINGILFSKYKDNDDEFDEDWDVLSEIIENGSSASDDIAPLRTAHVEMRYYSLPKDTPTTPKKQRAVSAEDSQNAHWTPAAVELAKYNYTQSKKEDDKEKDEGPSDLHTPSARVWDLSDEEVPGKIDDKTSELVEAFIKALGHPYTSNLAKVELSPKGKPQRFLVKTDVDALRTRLLKLLSGGVSLEPPVCGSQSEAAEFVEKLLKYLETPFVCFTNNSPSRGSKFWRKGFGDEGFFIVSASKIVMIWFLGYD